MKQTCSLCKEKKSIESFFQLKIFTTSYCKSCFNSFSFNGIDSIQELNKKYRESNNKKLRDYTEKLGKGYLTASFKASIDRKFNVKISTKTVKKIFTEEDYTLLKNLILLRRKILKMENKIEIISKSPLEEKLNETSNKLKKVSDIILNAMDNLDQGKISLDQAKVILNMGNTVVRARISSAYLDNQIIDTDSEEIPKKLSNI